MGVYRKPAADTADVGFPSPFGAGSNRFTGNSAREHRVPASAGAYLYLVGNRVHQPELRNSPRGVQTDGDGDGAVAPSTALTAPQTARLEYPCHHLPDTLSRGRPHKHPFLPDTTHSVASFLFGLSKRIPPYDKNINYSQNMLNQLS